MRSLRFIFIGIITFLFVTNIVFLRRTVSVLLCGVLSFNSTSCYSFLNNYGKADAAAPPSSAVVTSKDFSFVEKDKQKVAGCLFGVCVNLPQIPGVTGGDPLGVAKTAIVKQIGEAVGVGSPLLLDQKTAYPDVSDQVKDFHPQKLTIISAEDLQKPLPPGDYSLDVIAYCTQFSIHAPGQGLPYKLAPLQGKQAPAISALLSRGTLQGIAPATLNANSWRIQAGLPLKQWSQQDQALIHKLIPEYEKGLEGDYLQQIENTYNQFRLVPGIPSLNDLLRQSGAPGQLVLQLRQARQTLADQTISAERLPELLYEPTGDGLPRVLPASKDASPSRWAEIQPGVFARFTVIEGNLGKNLLEFRVTPKVIAAINNSATVATKSLNKNLQVSRVTNATEQAFVPVGTALVLGAIGYLAYSVSHPAQALIPKLKPSNCKDPNKPRPGDIVIYKSPKGGITHSGVVSEVNQTDCITIEEVESKWGNAGLYLHNPNNSVYTENGDVWTVWRAKRRDDTQGNYLKTHYIGGILFYFTDAVVDWNTDNTVGTLVLNLTQKTEWFGNQIKHDREAALNYISNHPGIKQVGEQTIEYNCHGFTFTGGQTGIFPIFAQKILDENRYFSIKARDTNGNFH